MDLGLLYIVYIYMISRGGHAAGLVAQHQRRRSNIPPGDGDEAEADESNWPVNQGPGMRTVEVEPGQVPAQRDMWPLGDGRDGEELVYRKSGLNSLPLMICAFRSAAPCSVSGYRGVCGKPSVNVIFIHAACVPCGRVIHHGVQVYTVWSRYCACA